MLAELAIVLPVLLAVVGAIIDGGWAFHQAALVTAAAEASQRALAIQDTGAGHCAGDPPGSYAVTARGAALAAAPHLGDGGMSVVVRYVEPACAGRMRTLTVVVTHPITPLTPWLAPFLAGRTVTGQASAAVEEVPPPWWSQGDVVQTQQAQLAATQAQLQSAQAQLQSDQARFTADQAQLGADQAQIQTQQAQLSSLNAAYQAGLAAIGSLSTSVTYYYQQWLSTSASASSLAQAANYYYTQWQQALSAAGSDGGREQ